MADNQQSQAGIRSFATLLQDYDHRLSLRTPADMIILLIYCMPVYGAFRVCIDAGVFRTLAQASPRSVSIRALVQGIPDLPDNNNDDDNAAAAEEREEYLARMLAGVCALNFADEAGPGAYRANALTLTMAEAGFERGFNFCFDSTFGPRSSVAAMRDWSRESGFRAPATATDGPYQRARGIVGTTTFQDWGRDGSILDLSVFMQRIQADRLNWSEWFPADVLFDGHADGGVFLVDVGGGFGHDLSGMAGRYPDKKMRLVLQDQPEVIHGAKEQNLDSRIEFMDHDFFEAQPVKGAHIVGDHPKACNGRGSN